jgi:hypothetical protein
MGLAGFTAAMALVATVASCAQEGAVKNMDQVSRDRLRGVPEDATVLVSVRAESVPAELPPLGEEGREIMRTPGAVLVEILHRNLSKLDAIPGIEDAAYWAPGEAGGRIDGWFRRRLLTAWAAGDTTAIAVTVTFPSDAEAERSALEAAGAEVRTVAGPVVTLAAPPMALFRILAVPRLQSLQGPRPLRMLDRP